MVDEIIIKGISQNKKENITIDLYGISIKERNDGKVYFTYGNNELIQNKELGGGGFGTVYLFKSRDDLYKIAVKIYADGAMQSNNDKGGMIHEKNVVGRLAELYRTNRNIGIISNRIIEHNTKSYLLMEFADGNLNELHKKVNLLNDKNIFKILYHTSKILETLSFHNLFYTDLKPDNILYKIKEGDRIEVVLGDIGGICLGDYYEATPEYSSHEILVFNQGSCNHINSIWGLMIMFLRAFNYDPNYIYVKDCFRNEFLNKTGIDIDALTKTVTQIEKTPIEKNIIIIYKMYYFDYLRKEIYNNMIRFKHDNNEVTEVMNVYAKYFMFIASSNDFSISIKDVSMIFQQMMD